MIPSANGLHTGIQNLGLGPEYGTEATCLPTRSSSTMLDSQVTTDLPQNAMRETHVQY